MTTFLGHIIQLHMVKEDVTHFACTSVHRVHILTSTNTLYFVYRPENEGLKWLTHML